MKNMRVCCRSEKRRKVAEFRGPACQSLDRSERVQQQSQRRKMVRMKNGRTDAKRYVCREVVAGSRTYRSDVMRDHGVWTSAHPTQHGWLAATASADYWVCRPEGNDVPSRPVWPKRSLLAAILSSVFRSDRCRHRRDAKRRTGWKFKLCPQPPPRKKSRR